MGLVLAPPFSKVEGVGFGSTFSKGGFPKGGFF
jgi:hypothetical protein